MSRRLVLGSATAAAGASVAAGLLVRKSQPVIHTPVAEAPEPLHDLSALVPTQPRRTLPALSFLDGSGATHKLEEFAGRAVVLNLWATWCAPCIRELPSLATLARRAPGAGLTVIALSEDRGGAAAVQSFIAAHGIAGLGIFTDSVGAAEQALALRGLPTTLLLDRGGREAGRLEGAADWGSDAALARIQTLLA